MSQPNAHETYGTVGLVGFKQSSLPKGVIRETAAGCCCMTGRGARSRTEVLSNFKLVSTAVPFGLARLSLPASDLNC